MKYAVTCLAIVVLGLWFAASASDKAPAADLRVAVDDEQARKEIADLKADVAGLQAELDALKQRLKTLENADKLRMQTVPAPGPLAKPIPPDWERRDFNGREYYIIPLTNDQTRTEGRHQAP